MKLVTKKIHKSLSPSFRALKPKRDDIDSFKSALKKYFNRIDSDESEENLKTHLMDLLKPSFAPDHLVEQQGDIDFVIRTGKKGTNAGVMFEAKRSKNKSEMISAQNLNRRALHEIILYFMRERASENTDIKYLTICTEHEFFIFSAEQFERTFYNSSKFKKDFEDWASGKKSDHTTKFFYNSIAKPFVEKNDTELVATYFCIDTFKNELDKDNDKKLIPLFKILSPEHLLKKSFVNDSNSLNKAFYDELLFIMGLTEAKEGGKRIIRRLDKAKRSPGSIIENTISKLTRENDFSDPTLFPLYGSGTEERAFNIGLELSLTWVNRLLFLKLLEAQTLQYHDSKLDYKFLNHESITDWDELSDLFFGVLALKPEEREDHIKEKHNLVPYLNSSLFEKTSLEKLVGIHALNNTFALPLFSKTVLKNDKNKPKCKELKTLEYILQFLDAYDFSSEGSEEIQEDSKTIINASVLGLIFEKINGYKEGSIFTPGYITEYMSRKVLEKTVLEKFQERHPKWSLEKLTDLNNYLPDYRSPADTLAYNELINSIKICDPAVGSGHFLVSCLNELIAIKSELGLLADEKGNRLSDFRVDVDNDEIIITDANTGALFNYRVVNSKVAPRIQNVQKLLFAEKQALIENSLFGVDINPNSVKICRLRLWIELLKSAYYRESSGYTELETLPNIDINIKRGNSLLSRYRLDQNLSEAFSSADLTVGQYKKMVQSYKTTKDRKTKLELSQKIDTAKKRINNERLQTLEADINKEIYRLQMLESQVDLFVLGDAETKARNSEIESYQEKVSALRARKKAMLESKTFLSAMEWRFEFPEVLNKKGAFEGFDIIIANPPYMRIQDIEATQPDQKPFYEASYRTAKGSYDLANLFFELASNLAKDDGTSIFIFPHKFFNSANGEALRELLVQKKMMNSITHFGANMIFDNADTYTCVAMFDNAPANGFKFRKLPFHSNFRKVEPSKKRSLLSSLPFKFIKYSDIQKASKLYGSNQWIFLPDKPAFSAFEKIHEDSEKVENVFNIFVGIQSSRDILYVVEKVAEKPNSFIIRVNPDHKTDAYSENAPVMTREFEVEKALFKPFLMGKDVHRYQNLKTDRLVFYPVSYTHLTLPTKA